MLIRNNERWIEDMYVEAATGDIVDDAIFERNSRISEQYNITISYQPSSHDNHETDAVNTILAGDDAYSLVMAHGRAAFAYANQGLVLDWNTDLPYVNLDNPWWDQDARKSLSIKRVGSSIMSECTITNLLEQVKGIILIKSKVNF
jgi:hypothetical protein